jgi:hypothetical protein
MLNLKTHNKTYVVLVICIGVIISVWLIQRSVPEKKSTNSTLETYSTENTNEESWKDTLSSIKFSDPEISKTSSQDDPNTFDETSLTGQMARDLFSRYLLTIKDNPTQENLDKISNSILSSENYTKISSVIYNINNINSNPSNSSVSIKQYGDNLNKVIIGEMMATQKADPLPTILLESIQNENKKRLSDLNVYVKAFKNITDGLLKMSVPSEFAELHLELLNSSSAVYTDLNAMSQFLDDPIKGIISVKQYSDDLVLMETVQEKINVIYKRKIGIK